MAEYRRKCGLVYVAQVCAGETPVGTAIAHGLRQPTLLPSFSSGTLAPSSPTAVLTRLAHRGRDGRSFTLRLWTKQQVPSQSGGGHANHAPQICEQCIIS